MDRFHIRAAKYNDLAAVQSIYNFHVQNGCATWNATPLNIEHFEHLFEHLKAKHFPFFVVEETQTKHIVGYADYANFRAIQGFDQTVELSIFLAKDYAGFGLGSKLLSLLIEHAKNHQKHVIVACIDSKNYASIRLHQRYGFSQTGYMPQVGQKFQQWRDLVLMQLVLNTST